MDIRHFFGGKPSKSENNKKAMPKGKTSKGKKPIPNYTSDPSDSEDPVPSKLAKHYKEKNEKTKPKKGRPLKAAKDVHSDDSDFAEEPKASKKSSIKTTKKTKSSKEAQLHPITAAAYFHGGKKPKDSDSERFSAMAKKCAKELDSPESMKMVQTKKPARKRQKPGSDLEELLELDGESKPSVSSPAKKRAVQTVVGSPRKVATKSPSKVVPTKSPRKKVAQETEDSLNSDKPSGGHLESTQSPAATKRRSYVDYLKREGPRALGSKEIPQGTEDCLAGLTFVISGILESITRDDAKALILKHGGRVTTAVSHKTNYLLLGRDAGESKSAKAKELGVKVLSDDDLYNLIRSKSAKEPTKAEPSSPSPKKKKKASTVPTVAKESSSSKDKASTESKGDRFDLWPEKYKPTTLKQVIGQQGPKSCLNKLLTWLRSWHQWHGDGAKKKTGAKKFGASDDGSSFKAALLSGPPGIGKTTTAQLCCKELHLPYVERNASDARNKKLLEQTCSASLTSRCLEQYYCKDFRSNVVEEGVLNHVLIMDEVDGMSGNEDRAGMQGLIELIKRTRIPIICICNDRQSPKVRSLANHCFDLRFHRPQTLQIRSALMSIVHKERLAVSPQTLDQLIEAAQHDIRQVLHNLSLMTSSKQNVTFDEARQSVKKDVNMNIFEATRSLFTDSEGSAQLSLIDRAEIFFTDYSLVPLFVQENYPHCVTGNNILDRLAALAEAAQFIAYGDVVDKQIRSFSSWSLLNLQATFSTVIPTELMKGYLKGQISFPAWFGKNSKTGRLFRQLQQLHLHTSIHSSADTASICLDYVDHMRDSIMAHLNREDVTKALDLCQSYDMSKDDVDTIMELGTWPHRKDPMSKLSSKTKAAFTRAFNTSTHMLPYDVVGATLNRRKRLPVDTLDVVENGQETADAVELLAEDDDSSDDEDTALLLKAAKVKSAPAKGKATAKKGRGGTKATSGRKKAVINV